MAEQLNAAAALAATRRHARNTEARECRRAEARAEIAAKLDARAAAAARVERTFEVLGW